MKTNEQKIRDQIEFKKFEFENHKFVFSKMIFILITFVFGAISVTYVATDSKLIRILMLGIIFGAFVVYAIKDMQPLVKKINCEVCKIRKLYNSLLRD